MTWMIWATLMTKRKPPFIKSHFLWVLYDFSGFGLTTLVLTSFILIPDESLVTCKWSRLEGVKTFCAVPRYVKTCQDTWSPLENEEILLIKSTFPFSWLQKESLIFPHLPGEGC